MTTGMALAEQFDRMWEMLRRTINRFSAEEWRAGATINQVPARWLFHAIGGMDFYSRSSPEQPGPHRFDVHWEAPAELLPSQQQLVEYLDEVRAVTRDWLTSISDAELMKKTAFPWTGDTELQRAIYALRHTQYHLGELSMLLRANGAEETEWR